MTYRPCHEGGPCTDLGKSEPGFCVCHEDEQRIAELEDAMRPFNRAVFNDNGDVTISTGHITHGDWLKLARVMRNPK